MFELGVIKTVKMILKKEGGVTNDKSINGSMKVFINETLMKKKKRKLKKMIMNYFIN